MKVMNNMIINDLEPNQIFVFGSNKLGQHIGGAAKLAWNMFGAEMEKPEGLQGRSYAIPTLDENMQKVPLEEIEYSLLTLVEIADYLPAVTFFLTPIGTGIAGYTLEDLESILPELPDNIIPTWKN